MYGQTFINRSKQTKVYDTSEVIVAIHAFVYNKFNHKNYNFLDCDWFKKLLFFTNSLAKLLSDSLLLDSLLSDSSISQIIFKAVV